MWLMYRCPRTGHYVRGDVADDAIGSGEAYLPVNCTGCGRIHRVNRETGVVIEGKEDVEQRASIPLWEQMTLSLAITLAVTTVIFFYKEGHPQQQHLVFFFLFPLAVVAAIYGRVSSVVCAVFASLAAAFFLYDPIYSLYVSDLRDLSELTVFAATAFIGAECFAAAKSGDWS